ncbi:hypothetical protein OSTOST_13391, partial [Ostertagia ostertagi]
MGNKMEGDIAIENLKKFVEDNNRLGRNAIRQAYRQAGKAATKTFKRLQNVLRMWASVNGEKTGNPTALPFQMAQCYQLCPRGVGINPQSMLRDSSRGREAQGSGHFKGLAVGPLNSDA